MPQCEFCHIATRTAQGVNSHIFQNSACLEKFLEKYSGSASKPPPFDREETCEQPYDNQYSPPPSEPLEHAPVPAPASAHHRLVEIEDIPDESEAPEIRWVKDYPGPAGATYGRCQSTFDAFREQQEELGHSPWAPFTSLAEWELAQWLMTSGVSQTKIDSFLKLESIRNGANPSFHNSRSLLQRVDALPSGPEWICTAFQITGDTKDAEGNLRTEEVELWHRNPVDCVQELMENPLIGKKNAYAPCRVYRDAKCTNREYGEMNTADWWHDTQDDLPPGATIVPVILSSDKTSLTSFSGDKQAYPVYLGIATTDHEIRRQSSAHAMVLIGYIPVSKLECFSKGRRSVEGHQLFHECMRTILKPLVDAGKNGVKMNCADGFVRMAYPIVAAYVADYPEQCLVAACKESACPKCTVSSKQRGDPVHSVLRDPEKTLHTLAQQSRGEKPDMFDQHSLRPIDPFWKNLPHCNIFASITPDILHQLHLGVFKDHIVSWATEAVPGGADEIDRRFRAMTPHPSLRHFKKGISLTTQWTGTEHKNMEKVFLGVLANTTEPAVMRAVRGVLDFIYYAQFKVHTDESLAHLDAAWVMFHENKQVFIDLDIRTHFNISKLHNIKHYLDSIRVLGAATGFNTEATERLHIDLAKVGYRASNKKAYTKQMTIWLRRQEAIYRFSMYLRWTMGGRSMAGTSPDSDSEEDDVDVDLDVDDRIQRPQGQTTTYRVAKKPALPRVTATSIEQDFGAQDFVHHLNSFLQERSITPHRPLDDTSTFPVYRRLYLSLPPIPEVSRSIVKETIIATKLKRGTITTQGIKKASPPRFSTVLVRTHAGDPSKGPLDGIRIVQVRLIFTLPEQYGSFDDPLLYVHWFKPLGTFDDSLGMFKTSFSSHNHRQRASIIPASQVIRSCHLIPHFGRSINHAWSSDTVLDDAEMFYLNPYLRDYDFYHIRYLASLFHFRNRRPHHGVARQRHLELVHAARRTRL